jgi:hypothetical protein
MIEAENLLLDYLSDLRGQLDRMEHRLEDVTIRLGHVERAAADHSAQLVEIKGKLDGLGARLVTIEKRLGVGEG